MASQATFLWLTGNRMQHINAKSAQATCSDQSVFAIIVCKSKMFRESGTLMKTLKASVQIHAHCTACRDAFVL